MEEEFVQSHHDPMTRFPDPPIAQVDAPSQTAAEAVPKKLTHLQEFEMGVLGWLGSWVVRLVGSSLRWEVHGWENWKAGRALGKRLVYTFWHREIFA
ncbi:MAG TPA: hypothetical protein VI455_00355, partial [Terriglobia bacterium]